MDTRLVVTVGLALLLANSACQKAETTATHATQAPVPIAVADVTTPAALPIVVDDPNYHVVVSQPAPCASTAPCTLRIALEAKGAFHVNDEYPYKFVADDANDKRGVHPAAGSFAKDAPTKGALTVPFTIDEGARDPVVSGTFKFSVCADEKCLIEAKKIAAKIAKP